MFNVGKDVYTVKFNQQKFKELPPKVAVEVIRELLIDYDHTNNSISNQALQSLFLLGLENESTGKRVGFEEGIQHFKLLTEKNGVEDLKKIIVVQFYQDMPELFKQNNKGKKRGMK